MKLFTVGPVQMAQRTLDVQAKMVPYFRCQEFSDMMLELDKKFKSLIGLKEGKVVYLTASGTGAMEAAIDNCLGKEDKVLVIVGGTFGKRFEDLCKHHDIPYDAVVVPFDDPLTLDMLKPYEKKGYTALLVNIDETSIGKLYDMEMLSNFCKRNNMLYIVDAISSFLADPYNMDKMGIDISIVSSQKGLCLAPGISIVALNNKGVERVNTHQASCKYFDFKDYFLNMERGQTPYTPAVGLLYELGVEVDYIYNQGIDKRIQEVKHRAEFFRSHMKELGFELPNYPLSNTVTPCILPGEYAKDLFEFLKNEKGLFINPCGGPHSAKMIRVAHVGDLTEDDYIELINAIKEFQEKHK